jgi:DNA mismatch repair protein MutS
MTQKVVEFYFETLIEYKKKLNKEKVALLMQVGSFLEIYGLIYEDGRKEGNLWDFCDNLNLKIGKQPQDSFNKTKAEIYMGGVPESFANPYIQKAVERFGWTIVIFEQNRIGNSNKFERKESCIISPGININSESNTFSNITMIIYIEQVKNYYTNKTNSKNNTNYKNIKHSKSNDYQINIGLSFIDCLTGANGVMSINNSSASDISIPFDELLKLLTIKNPNELIIYVQNCDESSIAFSDEDLINALHLFNYQFKIVRDTIDDKYSNLIYQSKIFETIYKKYRGILNIMQQLDIEAIEHTYSRIALTLLLEFVLNHDKTIIEKLERPEIMLNSDAYLMLANNCLEQLDIIDNMKSQETNKLSAKRISLLDLLDNTKTPLGKILLRQRLSIPITDAVLLEDRYKAIGELEELHNLYMINGDITKITPTNTQKISNTKKISNNNASNDKYGSPLHQLRMKLSGIKNINNYLRKIIAQKIQPNDIGNYIESLEKCITIYEYESLKYSPKIVELLPSENSYYVFTTLCKTFTSDINLAAFNSATIWSNVDSNPFHKGVSTELDNLQSEIDNDRDFLNILVNELSKIIDPKFDPLISNTLITVGENATKGIHIHTNKARKEALEAYFSKSKTSIKIGNYNITGKDITFKQMKESKWEIDIIYLKTSNGTLKSNTDKMEKLVKKEIMKWLNEKIVNNVDVLDSLSDMSHFISELDLLQSNVLNVVDKGYTCPKIDMNSENSYFKAEMLRHPIIEHISTLAKYVPNDIAMNSDAISGILLFGVNAVGKSSLMKSIGINIIMAQAGMYVASSKFTYKPYKYLFTRIRNNDNLYAGLSSFEVEMKEFKVILRYANSESIILGDELCSGTETQDATALVASGIDILSKRKCSFIFATHLHFLADMSYIKELKNIRLCHMAVELDPKNPKKLLYSRKIQNGSGPKSYGILVCESMDLDDEFIKKAKEIRKSMSNPNTNNNNNNNTNNNNTNNNNNSNELAILNSAVIGSKYNSDKLISMCEVCVNNVACDVHHINQQCDANHNNLIDSNDYGIFNKNKLWNLVALCKDCHHSVHNVPSKLEIIGYTNTSIGIELNYKWLRNNSADDNDSDDEIKINESKTITEITEITDITENINTDTNTKIKKKCKVLKISKITNNELSNLVKQMINDMKLADNTPKKIQYDLKRYHKIDMTQQEIRDFTL